MYDNVATNRTPQRQEAGLFPDPTQFLGFRQPVTFDTCEVIEERWANCLRHIVGAIEARANNLRRVKAHYIDCGEKDQFNLLYDASRFARRLTQWLRRRMSAGCLLSSIRNGCNLCAVDHMADGEVAERHRRNQ